MESGWFSAPHTYATDRIQVVVNGTWFVDGGNSDRQDAVPVGPGGYVKRAARTPHYDGVPADQPELAVIAVSAPALSTCIWPTEATIMASGVTRSTGSATAVRGLGGRQPQRPQRAREVRLHGL